MNYVNIGQGVAIQPPRESPAGALVALLRRQTVR